MDSGKPPAPTRYLDPNAVYEKALGSDGEIDELELVIYAVMEIETYIDMEGWTAFFTGSSAHLYPILRDALARIGDRRSLGVIDDFAGYLGQRGIEFDAGAIDEFFHSTSAALAAPAPPDWGRLFVDAHAERWLLLRRYLRANGADLAPQSPILESLGRAARALPPSERRELLLDVVQGLNREDTDSFEAFLAERIAKRSGHESN